MTTTRIIGATPTFDTPRDVRERLDQGRRGTGTQIQTRVGGDRGHSGAQDYARDTDARARAFQAALARGNTQKAAPQTSQRTATPSPLQQPTSTQRPSPLSGSLSPGRQDVRRSGQTSDSPLHRLPAQGGAGRDGWQRGERGDGADGDAEDVAEHRPAPQTDPSADADMYAEDWSLHGTDEQERDPGGTARFDDDVSSESVDTSDGTVSTGAERPASGLRDVGVPPNMRQPTGEDRHGGDDGGDRHGFARHTQDAMLAALARPLPQPYSGPLPGRGMAVAAGCGSPLVAPQANAQEDVDRTVLRGMLDAIDALRVDVDGRRGVEMDISVPGTQGVTVRVEEVEGCLQTTLSCREDADARRLQPGVQTLADHLATRFVRAARVRIESAYPNNGANNGANSVANGGASSGTSGLVSRARAVDAVQRSATVPPGRHLSDAGRELVAEAFAPLPGGESI